MDLASAVALRIRAQAESDTFTEACGAQESDIKDELSAVVGLFKNLLSSGNVSAMALRDGGFLYMRANTSTRAVNAARIRNAIDAMTLSQLKRIAADDTSMGVRGVLCACLEENLEDECISVSYAPHVSKRRPAQLSESARCTAASKHVEDAVLRYRQLKSSLSTLRKHKSGGKKRVAEAKERTDAVVLAHLQERATKRQRVQVVPAPPEAAAPTEEPTLLPALPVLLPEHADEAPAAPAAETLTLVVPDCEPKTYQMKRSSYTSRGKAPGLRAFAESLPACVREVSPNEAVTERGLRQLITADAKEALALAVVAHFEATVTASRGVPVEKLAVQRL